MACYVDMKPVLVIDDEEGQGVGEWEVGDYVHLVLNDGNSIYGEITEITEDKVVVFPDDNHNTTINFSAIIGYI